MPVFAVLYCIFAAETPRRQPAGLSRRSADSRYPPGLNYFAVENYYRTSALPDYAFCQPYPSSRMSRKLPKLFKLQTDRRGRWSKEKMDNSVDNLVKPGNRVYPALTKEPFASFCP